MCSFTNWWMFYATYDDVFLVIRAIQNIFSRSYDSVMRYNNEFGVIRKCIFMVQRALDTHSLHRLFRYFWATLPIKDGTIIFLKLLQELILKAAHMHSNNKILRKLIQCVSTGK